MSREEHMTMVLDTFLSKKDSEKQNEMKSKKERERKKTNSILIVISYR